MEVFADGEMGPISEESLISYQISRGLETNGVVDETTWTKLQSEIAPLAVSDEISTEPQVSPYGVAGELCTNDILFYKGLVIDDGNEASSIWTLSRNPPNRSEVLPFSIAPPYGKL